MKNVLVFILSFLFIFAVKGGTTSCDFTSVEAKIDGLLQTYPEIPGAGLVIGYEDEVFYEKYWKIYTENTIVPLASATKLLSGVTIMGLVDVGLIDLDAPVNGYLPEFTGDKAQMTVRQMFSHTAGMPINRLLENTYILNAYNGLTLAQAVSVLACCEPLMYEPNTAFAYGGASMHIAGRVAEVVSNKSWPDVFSQYLTTPLGINSMDFNGLGVTLNYRPAGGAKSSLPDYAKVLNMLLNKGRYHTTRLLSEQAVEEMLIDNVLDKQIIFPPEDSGIISRYGIGMWLRLNYLDGSLTGIHSAGARGFTPWIDYDLDYYAAFMVDDDNTRIKATMAEVREEIRQILSNNWCGTQPKPVTKELGLWYDPQHNGHGFEIQKIGNNHAGVFYTFTQQGEPIWYLMDVKNQQDGISGDLLYVKNTGTSNALQIDSHSVGNFVINFNPATDSICTKNNINQAEIQWNIDNEQDTWCIQPLLNINSRAKTNPNGWWWNDIADSGWGFNVYANDSVEFRLIYYYDTSGQPIWALASGDTAADEFDVQHAKGYCRSCAIENLILNKIGTFTGKITASAINDNANDTVKLDINNWQRLDFIPKIFSNPAY